LASAPVVAWERAWFQPVSDSALVDRLDAWPVVDWTLVDYWVGRQPVDSALVDFSAVQWAVGSAAPNLSCLDVAGLRCDLREHDTPAPTASQLLLHDP
jgi:hypothetical protein